MVISGGVQKLQQCNYVGVNNPFAYINRPNSVVDISLLSPVLLFIVVALFVFILWQIMLVKRLHFL